MDSSSSSPKIQDTFLLRIIDSGFDSFVLPLFETNSLSSLEIATEGYVYENHAYDLCVLSACDLGEALTVRLALNDGDPGTYNLQKLPEGFVYEGITYTSYNVLIGIADHVLFRTAFGFARVQVSVFGEGFASESFSTKDIPVQAAYQDQEQAISQMVNEIIDARNPTVVDWMFKDSKQDDSVFSFFKGVEQEQPHASVSQFLTLAKNALGCYEKHAGYFRQRAHHNVVRTKELIEPHAARQAGYRELMWIAKNPERLTPAAKEPNLLLNGKGYHVDRLEATKTTRSYDNYENALILGFLDALAQNLSKVERTVQAGMELQNSLVEQLLSITNTSGQDLPSLVILRASVARNQALRDEAHRLKRHTQQIKQMYSAALPGVNLIHPHKPRRTKVFQELKPYADIYAYMLEAYNAGKYDPDRGGFALHTYRFDKLYEYYALYHLLLWFAENGFEPDSRIDSAIATAQYTLQSKYYVLETQVSTVYHLANGTQNISLYYQPVFYGDEREEAGITLHRTTANILPDGTQKDSYYTPDFLLIVGEGENARNIVLDAKFRRLEDLSANAEKPGSNLLQSPDTALADAMKKYMFETAQEYPNTGVESVWLLCGRAHNKAVLACQNSGWAQKHMTRRTSGIATLSPTANALDDLFAMIGVV